MVFIIATPVSGPLEIHRDECGHLARLHRDGGGVLWDCPTLEEAKAWVIAEVGSPARVAPCVRKSATEGTPA